MSKNIRQVNPPADEPTSKHKHSYDALPTVPHNEATTPAARARTSFVDAFHAYGKERIRYLPLSLLKLKGILKLNIVFSPVYISIIAQGVAYLFCKVRGCSNCSGLSVCVMTFLSLVHFAAISYAEFRDNPKQHVVRSFILLSLLLYSFCDFGVAYFNTKCVPT